MNTSFERVKTGKDEWLTPPQLIQPLGEFDLDPCSPVNRPWSTAKAHYTKHDDGLALPWFGRVWLNPPYGNQTGKWMKKLADHGNGVALTFARTETKMFFDTVWNRADAILFLRGRLKFHNVDGTPGNNSAGAPSCLIAYGETNALSLDGMKDFGRYIRLLSAPTKGEK